MTVLFLVIGASLAVSFTCSVLEAVLLSITHSYVAVLEDQGDGVGVILARLRASIDEPIAAILTLNTIAHTAGATISGAIAARLWGEDWITLFSVVLTAAILIISEIIPKTIGATHWPRLARPTAYVLRGLTIVMKPIIVPLGVLHRWMAPGKAAATVSRAELEVLAEIGRREGTLDEDEWRVVSNVMNLDAVSVGEVMTPRTRIVALPRDATLAEAETLMLDEGHQRVPIYDGTIDQIVGVLLARDVWGAARGGVTEIGPILRDPQFVPESKPVEDLIKEMRVERTKMAIVLDEFGGTAGLVTLEDLIEEIVGEIQDEHDEAPPPFEETEYEVRISGAVPIWEVNERYALSLPEEPYDTVGGFLFGQIGRVAEVGDELARPEGLFRVLAMDGRRIDRLAFVRRPAAAAGPDAA